MLKGNFCQFFLHRSRFILKQAKREIKWQYEEKHYEHHFESKTYPCTDPMSLCGQRLKVLKIELLRTSLKNS